MKANDEIEKIYELVEQFDFKAISIEDQTFVLAHLSENEYNAMRDSVIETQKYFAQETEPILKQQTLVIPKRSNRFISLVTQPIPLYKVAASILVLIGLFMGYEASKQQTQPVLTSNTTEIPSVIYTDTVYVSILDTLEIIKERIVYVERKSNPELIEEVNSNSTLAIDCNKNICPKDIDKLKNLACNNKIENDSVLRQCLKYLN